MEGTDKDLLDEAASAQKNRVAADSKSGVFTMVPKARIVEVLQWTGDNVENLCNFVPTSFRGFLPATKDSAEKSWLMITTTEGVKIAKVGDYIVKGLVNGKVGLALFNEKDLNEMFNKVEGNL